MNCPRTLRVFPGDRPCGSCATWVLSVSTREPAHVFCVTVRIALSSTLRVADMLPSSLLRHLLPHVQSFEERLLRREPTKVVGRTTNADGWCHGGYACGVLDHTLRRYQDEITSRGAQGRGGIHGPAACSDDHLQGGGVQGLFQGRACSYYAIVTTIRFHSGWL